MAKRMLHRDTPQTHFVLERSHSRSKLQRYQILLQEWPVWRLGKDRNVALT
jgi:hypothetical protein